VKNLMHAFPDKIPPIKVLKTEKGYALIAGQHRVERAKRKGETEINAELITFLSVPDLIKDAASDNLEHGLSEKPSRRVDYALWLISQGVTQREAARIAQIDDSSITRRKQKMKAREQEQEPKEDERLKPLKRLFKAIEGLAVYQEEDRNLHNDIRECLGGSLDTIEDLEDAIVQLVEQYLLAVHTI